MKKRLLFIALIFMTFAAFGQVKSITEFREKKIQYYCEKDFNKVLSYIDNQLKLLEQNKSEYSEELYLTLKNCYLVDRLFFSLDEDEELPKNIKHILHDVFLDQEEVCEDFIGKRPYSDFSGDFLASLGDLKCQMPFVISIPRSIPKLTKSKEIYENAVINNPSCANLISQALWYQYSPAISGGSHKKAYELIQQAEKKASTKGDLFFSLMFKGQILDSLKRYDESVQAFHEAHALFPDETFSPFMERKLDIDLGY